MSAPIRSVDRVRLAIWGSLRNHECIHSRGLPRDLRNLERKCYGVISLEFQCPSTSNPHMKSHPALLLVLLTVAAGAHTATPPISLDIDARDTVQGIQHVHLVIPVRAGPLTLAYPKWIPGEHAADGPITQVVSLTINAGDSKLPWRRDPLDAFSFHVDVPRGVRIIDVHFDYLSPTSSFGDGYGRTPNVTPHLLTM